MFEEWTAKEIRRMMVYSIFGYIGFWAAVAFGIGAGITWLVTHVRWVN